MRNLLIVDDEKSVRESFRMLFKNHFNILLAESGEKALETIHRESIDIILLDLLIPDLNGMEILK
ncbi:response regulator, partial [Candidatus Calescamantes bacterium]|nr:response regulator [Candidatus Calescamantes bacterium]